MGLVDLPTWMAKIDGKFVGEASGITSGSDFFTPLAFHCLNF